MKIPTRTRARSRANIWTWCPNLTTRYKFNYSTKIDQKKDKPHCIADEKIHNSFEIQGNTGSRWGFRIWVRVFRSDSDPTCQKLSDPDPTVKKHRIRIRPFFQIRIRPFSKHGSRSNPNTRIRSHIPEIYVYLAELRILLRVFGSIFFISMARSLLR